MSIESLSRSLVKRLLGRRDVVKGASPILPTKPPSRGLRRAIQSALWPNTLGRVPVGGVRASRPSRHPTGRAGTLMLT